MIWSVSHVQVIEEIEEIMQDSPDMKAEHNPSLSDPSMISLDIQRASSPSYQNSECVETLPSYVLIP